MAETEEEEKEREAGCSSQLLTWASVFFTAQHPWRGQSKASRAQVSSQQKPRGTHSRRRKQRESPRVQVVNKGPFVQGLGGHDGQGGARSS